MEPPRKRKAGDGALRVATFESVVAALPGIGFNLDSLGWKAFQDLCGSVLRSVLGQPLLPFPEGPDGGRDFAFEGPWHESDEPRVGASHAVVQCKFRSRSRPLAASEMEQELPKIRRLVSQGRCHLYVLMTNCRITGPAEQKIRELVLSAGPGSCLVLGADYIDTAIRDHPALRALVPRVYGLGDLTQILDERAYLQATALLSSMHERLSKFVVTEPYRKAIGALNKHGCVLLLGPPAAGKSMIAATLAMAALDQWSCPTVKANSPEEFLAHWNPGESRQFFWIDDAFGTTQYQPRLSDGWNRVFGQAGAAVGRGTRIVMTSRDYIWAAARRDLKLSDFEPLESSQVVVDVRELTLENRRQILYNHLKYGGQTWVFRTKVKPFLDDACHVEPFLPEVARRFGDPQYTQRLPLNRPSIHSFFADPVDHLRDVVSNLPPDSQAALALIFVAGGALPSPVSQTGEQLRITGLFGSSIAGASRALVQMRDSVVSYLSGDGTDSEVEAPQAGHNVWTYRHPTIGEAFRRLIIDDPELLEVYLTGTPLNALASEITCGPVGLDGALVVDENQYPLILRRLLSPEDESAFRSVASFLARRCSDGFLRFCAATAPQLFLGFGDRLPTGLAARLLELGLLEELQRQSIVHRWSKLLLEELDVRALSEPGRRLLKQSELSELVAQVSDPVLASAQDRVWDLESDYDGSEAPDEWVDETRETISTLRDAFQECGQASIAAQLDSLIDDVEELVDTLADQYQEPDYDRVSSPIDWDRYATTGSDIFSDIDR